MIDRDLVFIAGGLKAGSLPNRPASLAAAFREARAFRGVLAVERQRPWRYLANRMTVALGRARAPRPGAGDAMIEHPWPFGALERRFVTRLVRGRPSGTVVWVADPKSATVFRDFDGSGSARPLLVFDAYDAWDLSPLVRGTRRRRAVQEGYRSAAELGDVIFANTPFMAERMRTMGARNVELLPNGAPRINGPAAPGRDVPFDRPYVAYVGRVHERIDVGLLRAVAESVPDSALAIAGPIEREPPGWRSLASLPNVRVLGPRPAAEARALMAGARACLVPHVVDDYALSQDAMKAWDAVALGVPVISTPIPPAVTWPRDLATIAEGPDAFVAAVRQALAGAAPGSADARLAFAASNSWAERASAAMHVIEAALRP